MLSRSAQCADHLDDQFTICTQLSPSAGKLLAHERRLPLFSPSRIQVDADGSTWTRMGPQRGAWASCSVRALRSASRSAARVWARARAVRRRGCCCVQSDQRRGRCDQRADRLREWVHGELMGEGAASSGPIGCASGGTGASCSAARVLISEPIGCASGCMAS
jgi:hypothetical protein